MKKIGIIGSGPVGKSLAKGFMKNKHQIMLGTRSTQKQEQIRNEFHNEIQTGDFAKAAEYGEIIVLAVSGIHAKNALALCGDKNLKGKIIIDVTNPIDENPPKNGVVSFFTNYNESLMEQLQKAFPTCHFVKAFNSVTNELMVNPKFNGTKPTMFICGNESNAKKEVAEILEKFGWETEDMGAIEASRAIEALCMLYCIPGIKDNKWNHAFKLLKTK